MLRAEQCAEEIAQLEAETVGARAAAAPPAAATTPSATADADNEGEGADTAAFGAHSCAAVAAYLGSVA